VKLEASLDLYRVRVGDYRIIYRIGDSSVLVLKIGHRGNVYKDAP
jgi:mRNA interferase RelE/StbE